MRDASSSSSSSSSSLHIAEVVGDRGTEDKQLPVKRGRPAVEEKLK
jgi:hypothetical protein